MSHFIIGSLAVKTASACTEVEAQLIELADTFGLTVGLSPATWEQLQLDVISCAGLAQRKTDVVFELLAPSGTADELISPYVLVDQWPKSLQRTFDGIAGLANGLLLGGPVDEVSIVFSEGYDTSYPVIAVSCESLAEILLKKFDECGEVPSLRIVIRS
jgi:hypothetical protein